MADRTWSKLSPERLGRFAERLAHLEFSARGFDVYVPDVDDRSIDFIVRMPDRRFIEIQVKAIRDSGYVFMRKRLFEPHDHLYIVLMVFVDSTEPEMFLIPSKAWTEGRPAFSSRDYGPGRKSEPEWGLDVKSTDLTGLEEFRFDRVVEGLA